MRDVYLVFKNGEKKLLSVEYYFFDQARVGDFILWEGIEYKINKKVFDPEEISIYINIEAFSNKDAEYIELIKNGSKLAAVKLYKENNNTDLKDAKDYIDELSDKINLGLL